MYAIEVFIGVDREILSPILKHIREMLKFYLKFKNMIIQKYLKLAYKHTVNSIYTTGLLLDKDDLFKELILSITKSIDKYNPKKGALTTYIQWWFRNAKINPEFGHEYGQTYSVSVTTRRKIKQENLTTFYKSLEDLSRNEEVSETLSNIENYFIGKFDKDFILQLINQVPDASIARLILDIPYKPT